MAAVSEQTRQLLAEYELWGVAEVCEALGTTAGNLGRWPNLPEPVMRVRATRLWFADDIREYRRVREAKDQERALAGGVS